MSAYSSLSGSVLWARQRGYYEAEGPAAWASGAVPHQVTCNPDMARALADVIVGFATDRARARGPRPAGEPLRPLYIVELGAGVGRLGFHVTRALRAAVELAVLGWRPIYVMTDLVEATVAWWQAHPWLAPLVQAGLLDFARYDVLADDALALRVSGRVIGTRTRTDEMIVIANYLFDSLPHDVFEVDGGEPREWQVAMDEAALEPGEDVGWSPRGWRTVPIERPRYRDRVHDALLDEYRGHRGFFTIPTGALAALERVRALTRGPLLVLSADKGACDLPQSLEPSLPAVVCHGSVSMTVNYHALGQWALAHGGTWMHTDHHARAVEVCAFVLGAGLAADHPSTVVAFDRAVARRGPDDLHSIKRVLVENVRALSLPELLAYLRLSSHDPKLFLACAPAIRAALPTADEATRDDLARAMARVWDAYLPIGESADLAFALARLYVAIERPAPALDLLAASRVLHGEREATRALDAACRDQLAARAAVVAPW